MICGTPLRSGLAKVTGADAYELERRLGHRSQRYNISALYQPT